MDAITKLRHDYNSLPPYKNFFLWLFFPRKFRIALSENDSSDSQYLKICKIFLDDTWRIQRWLFYFFNKCISDFNSSPLICSLRELNKTSLLTGEKAVINFSAVFKAHHDDIENNEKSLYNKYPFYGFKETVGRLITGRIKRFNDSGLFDGDSAQNNFDAIAPYLCRGPYTEEFIKLYNAGLLTKTLSAAIAKSLLNLKLFTEKVITLKKERLFTDAMIKAFENAFTRHADLDKYEEALVILKNAGLLDGEHAEAIFKAIEKNERAYCIIYLQKSALINPENILAITSISHFNEYYYAIENLSFGGAKYRDSKTPRNLLTQDTFNHLIKSKNPKDFVSLYCYLMMDTRYFNNLDENLKKIIIDSAASHEQPIEIGSAVTILHNNDKQLLNDALTAIESSSQKIKDLVSINFDIVMKHEKADEVIDSLQRLENAGLLKDDLQQQIFDAVVAGHRQPLEVAMVLELLVKEHILLNITNLLMLLKNINLHQLYLLISDEIKNINPELSERANKIQKILMVSMFSVDGAKKPADLNLSPGSRI